MRTVPWQTRIAAINPPPQAAQRSHGGLLGVSVLSRATLRSAAPRRSNKPPLIGRLGVPPVPLGRLPALLWSPSAWVFRSTLSSVVNWTRCALPAKEETG